MADALILNIKSWRVSDTTGRKHLLEISPQFPSDTEYSYEERIIDEDDTVTVVGGGSFTYIWTDKVINYVIDEGSVMTGQLIMLSNNKANTSYSIVITGVSDTTKVSITLVS